jgi:3-deoxy-D-manno-octulosonic-acid transferase
MRIAQQQLKTDYISFLPYDFIISMALAYNRINPQALFIAEAELWPNLLALARAKNIPRILINARITPRSNKRLQKFTWIFKILFGSFTTILAQSEHDAEIFKSLGNKNQDITTLGNLKAFNVVEKKEQYSSKTPQKNTLTRILLAGSIHPTEEVIYLELFTKLKISNPQLKLILAPRHFGWQNNLIKTVQSYRLSAFVWTEQNELPSTDEKSFVHSLEQIFMNHDVLLVCKLGEMFALYPYTDLFFLGGTFVPIGGHNLLEPAVWGIPTIIGPHYGNCTDIADRLENLCGLIKAHSKEDLFEKTKDIMTDHALRKVMGQNSKNWIYQEAITVEQKLSLVIQQIARK